MKQYFTKSIIYLITYFFAVTNLTKAQCFKQISTAWHNTSAIKTDGTLWAWGWNDFGQLGNGTTTATLAPIKIGNANNWLKISNGSAHTLALKTDGTLWSWGLNDEGQLGDGTTVNKTSPIQIGNATDWVNIDAGMIHSFAIKSNGTLWAWGNNFSGQLGDGTEIGKLVPTQIGTANNWAKITANGDHTVAIKTDGTLWAWGLNGDGQLGDGTTVNKTSPIQIGTGNNWVSVEVSGASTIALKADGTLWSWGWNQDGQLGNGTATTGSTTPQQIGTDNNWSKIAFDNVHCMAIKSNGTLWGWGNNSLGQIGDGSIVNKLLPIQVGFANNWDKIAVGPGATFILKQDGSLWVTGGNSSGQLGDGTTVGKIVPTAINCPGVLPIILQQFIVTKKENSAILQWQSKAEINSKAYEVERSVDGNKFDKLTTIEAKGVAANYDFLDNNLPTVKVIYYRLRLIDKDGKYSYSEVRQLSIINAPTSIKIYPNPVSYGKLNVDFGEEIKAKSPYIITTVQGKTVQQGVLNNQQETINVQKLTKGMYIIKFAGKQKQFVVF